MQKWSSATKDKGGANPLDKYRLIQKLYGKKRNLKQRYPVCQDKEFLNYIFPKGQEKEEILNRVHSYTNQKRSLLKQSWEQYITNRKLVWIIGHFILYKNRYRCIKQLRIDFKIKNIALLNLMRCEAHIYPKK